MKVKALWIAGLMLAATAGQVEAAFVTYDANAAFVANEAGSESNPFGPFSVGYSSTLGGFTAATAAYHTNNWGGFDPAFQGWANLIGQRQFVVLGC